MEWAKLRRAVAGELPPIDPSAGLGGARALSPLRGPTAPRWPAPAAELASLRAQLSSEPARRKDASLYSMLTALSNGLEWVNKLGEGVSFALAGCAKLERFLPTEIVIIGAAVAGGGGGGGGGGDAAEAPPLQTDEHFYVLLDGLLAIQIGSRVVGHLHPGQLWASFGAAVARAAVSAAATADGGHGHARAPRARGVDGDGGHARRLPRDRFAAQRRRLSLEARVSHVGATARRRVTAAAALHVRARAHARASSCLIPSLIPGHAAPSLARPPGTDALGARPSHLPAHPPGSFPLRLRVPAGLEPRSLRPIVDRCAPQAVESCD
jgi:hypothetical protein